MFSYAYMYVFTIHEWTKKRNFSFFVILFFFFFLYITFFNLLRVGDIRWQENSRKLTSVCAPLPLPPPESIRSNADGIRWCCWTFFSSYSSSSFSGVLCSLSCGSSTTDDEMTTINTRSKKCTTMELYVYMSLSWCTQTHSEGKKREKRRERERESKREKKNRQTQNWWRSIWWWWWWWWWWCSISFLLLLLAAKFYNNMRKKKEINLYW